MTAFRRHELAEAVYLAQLPLDLREYLNVDLFAGGGGASEAMEEATGECVDIQPATTSDGDSIELFGALASELAAPADQFSTSLKGLAARLEDAALAAEQSRERLAGDLEAVRKFKAALAALP